ncbi:MAG TPA: H-X9-DG-CTERM domain-containing protein, partial [Phycisphaerae bacterium]|nr:H-X9-DG-CTERM domain-containing protein [Phycisphaerae bacterium]
TLIELLVVAATIALLAAILLPSFARARQSAAGAVCLSNLRQMLLAAQTYTQLHRDRYPISQYMINEPTRKMHYKWDFTTIMDKVTRTQTVRPGLLWMGTTHAEVHQCPLFEGNAQSPGDPYTGYNYNTSYIGHGQGEPIEAPIVFTQVRRPAECAIFGDGEFADGANKFMRAPWKDLAGGGDDLDHRTAGTQGYRHLGRTNVAFCDGHASAWNRRCTSNGEGKEPAPGTGFLSNDNRLYDPLARSPHPSAAAAQPK